MKELTYLLSDDLPKVSRLRRFQQGTNQSRIAVNPMIAFSFFQILAWAAVWEYTGYPFKRDPNDPLKPDSTYLTCHENDPCQFTSKAIMERLLLLLIAGLLFACSLLWKIDSLPNISNGIRKAIHIDEYSYMEILAAIERKFSTTVEAPNHLSCFINKGSLMQDPVYYAEPLESPDKQRVYYDRNALQIAQRTAGKEIIPHKSVERSNETLTAAPEIIRATEDWLIKLHGDLVARHSVTTSSSMSHSKTD